MPATQAPIRIAGFPLTMLLRKAAVLVIVGLIFGWIYAWASPWAYPQEKRVGIVYGVAHGALMPMALPSLLMGKDVDIYAPNNSGRLYKVGYTIGINICGLIFFGSAFWRPAKKNTSPEASSGQDHKSQER